MIEYTVLLKDAGLTSGDSNPSDFRSALNAISSAYMWNSKNVNISGQLSSTYGDYYFTDTSHIKIDYFANSQSYLGINLVTPNETKRIDFIRGGHCTMSIGKTSKGICICAYSGSNGSRDPHFYNLYVGELTLLDGTTTKGCIYVADDNSYVVATDSGISEEATFTAGIDNTKKAYLVPVTDSTTGAIFSDVYMMIKASLQYNNMKIIDTDKKYLCGKAICMAD